MSVATGQAHISVKLCVGGVGCVGGDVCACNSSLDVAAMQRVAEDVVQHGLECRHVRGRITREIHRVLELHKRE